MLFQRLGFPYTGSLLQTDVEVGSGSHCTLVVAVRMKEGGSMELGVVRMREEKWIVEGVGGEE